MLVAQRPQPEPFWRPVMGATVLFDPITRPMLRRARRAAIEVLGLTDSGPDQDASLDEQMADLGDALSHALIIAGARDWKDVGRAVLDEHDEPVLVDGLPQFDELPFTAENLAIVLADPLAFEAFDAAYVIPFVQAERERAAPGKGSSPSPNGISTAETQGQIIAASPAPRATATDVRNAPTSSTKPKRKPRKRSGQS
ncbi:hypothetical protein [Sphingomonas sp. R86521]|uniref:hypothetical protein n=1 Tax=Sphingomonas sp. R86521 TaxID=3093860 RepID=UPI0036D3BBB1